ncbi:MAG TPA: transcription termination/antitermination factor NusG [Candidatus Omnitrophica bacterium]|nr:MAG: transcription termination/antitermination protein NusG [Candidatus Omnitrophota bacterium]RKY43762.1 MAG: transcription termination/antitermination protein NusG [Candidatus Omnitrophota bacterium]HEC69107.1 transcription termination/antitermination factor NusG [Candidatus Omnitrophota bacterium]
MKRWYIIHTLSGAEEKVKANLEAKVKAKNLQDLIDEIIIPKEQVSEVRRGQKRILERKFFPGYVLIHMEMNESTWLFVKKTPGVTSFIGAKNPVAVPGEEVEKILKKSEETQAKPLPKVAFEKGETVRVVEGPFVNFNGLVEEVNPQKGKLKVAISIFGRSTPVELEFWQVEKI